VKATTKDLCRVKGSDILTDDELTTATSLFREGPPAFAAMLVHRVLTPALPRINQKLGMECDPWDLAYAIEYHLSKKRRAPTNERRG